MLIVSHVVAGAVIASGIPSLWIAVPLAFLSHFLLDMIPHVQAPTDEGYRPNRRTYMFVALDLIVSAIFLVYFNLNINALLIVFAAILPDLLDLTRYNALCYKIFKPYYDFHDKIQNETNKPIGFITQIVLIVVGIIVLGAWR